MRGGRVSWKDTYSRWTKHSNPSLNVVYGFCDFYVKLCITEPIVPGLTDKTEVPTTSHECYNEMIMNPMTLLEDLLSLYLTWNYLKNGTILLLKLFRT